MTAGPIAPRLFDLAWPLVLGNLLQTLYNLADIFWVGRVSPAAVAAVSLMFPLSWLFVSTAMGLTAATIALVSQHVGAGDDRTADRIVAQTCLLATAVSAALAIGGFAVRHRLLTWIGASGQVFVEALAYVEVIFLALPFTFLFFAFRASLQGAGDTRTAMWLAAVSSGFNIVLDPFLVLGWGPFPAWGTRGAAWATFLSRLFAALVGIALLVRGSRGVQLHVRDLRPDPALLGALVDVGYPATLDGWARSFAAVVMAALVARFGPIATAAYGIGVRMMSVSWTVSGAVAQATATGVGQNLGAGTPDRAAAVTRTATTSTMGLLLAAGGLCWLAPTAAMGLFIADSAVIGEGVVFLRIVALSWTFFGGLMVIQGAFRGAGDTRIAMALSICSRWIFRLPAAAILAFGSVTVSVADVSLGPITLPGGTVGYRGLGWGVEGLWWAYTLGAVVSFALGLVWFGRGTWRESVIGPSSGGGTATGGPSRPAVDDAGDGGETDARSRP